MLHNEQYKGNKEPVKGKKPADRKPAGDRSMKMDEAAKSRVDEKIDKAAWDAKQPNMNKQVSDNPDAITPKSKPLAGQAQAEYPDREPNH